METTEFDNDLCIAVSKSPNFHPHSAFTFVKTKLASCFVDTDGQQNIDAILQVHIIKHVISKINKNISITNFKGWVRETKDLVEVN